MYNTNVSSPFIYMQVTLQLEPMFKRSITNRVVADTSFEYNIQSFGLTTQHGDITWYPSQAEVVYRDDIRVPLSTPGNGENDFTGFQSQLSLLIAATRGIGLPLNPHACFQFQLHGCLLVCDHNA